jgi:hypothetical protein
MQQQVAMPGQLVITVTPPGIWSQGDGLDIFGEGEWAAALHGGKGIRGWKKLHIGVDGDGVIVDQRLTDASVDDGNVGVGVGVDFVDGVPGKVCRVIGDGAYDSRAL